MLTGQVPLPDEVRETSLELRETGTDSVMTVLKLLSPTNKRPGRGRRIFEDKRLDVLGTRTHLVEVDLIRAGEAMPLLGNGSASAYRILVSRGDRRPNATLYAFGVCQPIPTFPLPLKPHDQEPPVDIGKPLHDLYDRASYDLRLDYSQTSPPVKECTGILAILDRGSPWPHTSLDRESWPGIYSSRITGVNLTMRNNRLSRFWTPRGQPALSPRNAVAR